MRRGFVSTMRKGFHMTFPNGLTVSVQWGAGNYCDNHFPKDMDFTCSKDAESDTAEVAVINSKDEFVDPQQFFDYEITSDGMIAGYLDPSQVAELLIAVRDWPNTQGV